MKMKKGQKWIQRRVMRMKTRSAAMKEYLRAATRIANEMNKSCQRTWTLAHVRRPVNPSARTLSGSGSKRAFQLKLKMGRFCLLKLLLASSSPLEPVGCCCSCLSPRSLTSVFLLLLLLLLLLLTAKTKMGWGFREVRGWGLTERGKGNGNKCWRREGRGVGIESEDLIKTGVNPTNTIVCCFAILT